MYFGGKNCKLVHERISKFLSNFLVFSICSDERISDDLERHLLALDENLIPDSVVVLGDLIENPPSICPASSEVIRLLSLKSDKIVRMCWIDSNDVEISSLVSDDLKWKFFDLRFESIENVTNAVEKQAELINGVDFVVYKKLILILGDFPKINLNNLGEIESISFLDGQDYPRSLMKNLSDSDVALIWYLLSQLNGLHYLNLSFSGLRSLPDIFFYRLEKLDIRGNEGINLDNLYRFPNLKYLNISACGLTEVPKILEALNFLEVFLCYKNYIKSLFGMSLPSSIVRMSFYRNDVADLSLDLNGCEKVSEINIGANPIRRLSIGSNYKVINLRVRHIDDGLICRMSRDEDCLINICNY